MRTFKQYRESKGGLKVVIEGRMEGMKP